MSAIQGYTTNYQFAKINFDFPRWHTYANSNWDLLDAILSAFISNQQIRGLWVNSTIYAEDDRVLDEDNGILYLCLVNHTSAASGTFAADRTANPTYWQPAITTPTFRGNWQTGTVYSLQDFVVNSGQYAICEETHTSGTFATDVSNGKWSILIDVSGVTEPAIPTTAEVDLASAATCDIGAAASGFVRITGTTTITSFGTGQNKTRLVRFADALTLTHNLTSLILPTGTNITTAAGDTALFRSDGSGNWRCYFYQRASGAALTTPWATVTGAPTTLSGYGITDAQPLDGMLTALAALSAVADRYIYFTGADTPVLGTITSAARDLLDDANAAAMLTTLGAVGTTRTLTASTGLTGGGDLSANRSFSIDKATDANTRSAASNKVITSDLIESASALVALTDAATVAVDWDAGINFSLTVTDNRAIGNPTNGQPGTWRTILVQGNSTTDRTITFGANYLGEVPTITDCDDARWYLLTIFCVTTSHFVVSSKKAKGT